MLGLRALLPARSGGALSMATGAAWVTSPFRGEASTGSRRALPLTAPVPTPEQAAVLASADGTPQVPGVTVPGHFAPTLDTSFALASEAVLGNEGVRDIRFVRRLHQFARDLQTTAEQMAASLDVKTPLADVARNDSDAMTPQEFVFGNKKRILTVGQPGGLLNIGLTDAMGFDGPFQEVQRALEEIATNSVELGARLDKNYVPPLLLAARPMSGKTEFLKYLWRHPVELCKKLQKVHPTLKRVVVVFASYSQHSTAKPVDVWETEKHLVRRLALSLAGRVSYDPYAPVQGLERFEDLDKLICNCTGLARKHVGIVVVVDEVMKLSDVVDQAPRAKTQVLLPDVLGLFLDTLSEFALKRNTEKCFAAVVLSSLQVLPVTHVVVNKSGRPVWPIVLPANVELKNAFVARVLQVREADRGGVSAEEKFRIATLAQITCEARNVQQYDELRKLWPSQSAPSPVNPFIVFGFQGNKDVAEFELLRDIFACQMRGDVFIVKLLDLHLRLPSGETSDPLANRRMHDFVDRLFQLGAIIRPSGVRPAAYQDYTLSFTLHVGHILAVENRLLDGMDKILRTALIDSLTSENLDSAIKGWEKSMVAAADLRRHYFKPNVAITLDVLFAKAAFISPNLRAQQVLAWNGWLTCKGIDLIDASYLANRPSKPQYVYSSNRNRNTVVDGVIMGCTELRQNHKGTRERVAVLVHNKLRASAPRSEVKEWLDAMVAFGQAMGQHQRHVHLLFVSSTVAKSIVASHDIAAMHDVIICGAEGLDDLLQAFGTSLLKTRLNDLLPFLAKRKGKRSSAPASPEEE